MSYNSLMSKGGAGVRWVRAEGVLWRRTQAAIVMLTAEAREPFSLTGSGRSLWEVLGDPIDEHALCLRLARLHGADVALVAPAVRQVLGDLARRGAVVQRP